MIDRVGQFVIKIGIIVTFQIHLDGFVENHCCQALTDFCLRLLMQIFVKQGAVDRVDNLKRNIIHHRNDQQLPEKGTRQIRSFRDLFNGVYEVFYKVNVAYHVVHYPT